MFPAMTATHISKRLDEVVQKSLGSNGKYQDFSVEWNGAPSVLTLPSRLMFPPRAEEAVQKAPELEKPPSLAELKVYTEVITPRVERLREAAPQVNGVPVYPSSAALIASQRQTLVMRELLDSVEEAESGDLSKFDKAFAQASYIQGSLDLEAAKSEQVLARIPEHQLENQIWLRAVSTLLEDLFRDGTLVPDDTFVAGLIPRIWLKQIRSASQALPGNPLTSQFTNQEVVKDIYWSAGVSCTQQVWCTEMASRLLHAAEARFVPAEIRESYSALYKRSLQLKVLARVRLGHVEGKLALLGVSGKEIKELWDFTPSSR